MIRWLAVRRYNWIDAFGLALFMSFLNNGHFWWGLALSIPVLAVSYTVEKAAQEEGDK